MRIRVCFPAHCLFAQQVRHPLLVELQNDERIGARQSLASTLSALAVAATSYCHPGRHAKVVTPYLLTPLFKPARWGKPNFTILSADCRNR